MRDNAVWAYRIAVLVLLAMIALHVPAPATARPSDTTGIENRLDRIEDSLTLGVNRHTVADYLNATCRILEDRLPQPGGLRMSQATTCPGPF